MRHLHGIQREHPEHLLWKAVLLLFLIWAIFGARTALGYAYPTEENIGRTIVEQQRIRKEDDARAERKAEEEKLRAIRDWEVRTQEAKIRPEPSVKPHP